LQQSPLALACETQILKNIAQIRVLLVDDNQDDRQWIARLLAEDRALQCTIDEAGSLIEATRLLEARGFDLGIVDWELPDGIGIELAQHPSVLGQNLPLIFITGAERPEQGSFAVAQGAADFLPKDDLTPRALSRACAHALMRSRLEGEIDALRKGEVTAARREREARILAEFSLVEERKARERVSALHALSSTLSAATTADEILTIAVEHLSIFEHAEGLGIYLVQRDALQLQCAGGPDRVLLDASAATPLSSLTPLTEAVRTRRLVRIHDRNELRARMPQLADPPFCAWLAMPLMSQNEVLGVLDIRFAEGALPAFDGLAYIELVAQNIAQALHRAQLYDEARLATQFEQRLLAVVGHDLRTPLWAITMVAQTLKLQDADSKLLIRLERSAKRMADLISDVLDRAAIRHGLPSTWIAESTALDSVLSDQVDELRVALPHTDIRLEIAGPVSAQCEPSRTAQIISNLVRNAVQHGQADAPVSIRLSERAGRAQITVHNHGAPIPIDDLPRLFDPFERGRRAGGVGTGLGLFIVHEIVSSLGGEVKVESDDAGTTFTVTLPNHPSVTSATSGRAA
jgi:signal transduction histidine kinase